MKKPSVTKLVEMLDRPALMRWANRQGLLGIDIEKERREKKNKGESLHSQIERKEFIDPLHAYNFTEFMRDKEILRTEGEIETDWFVGRFDCKFRWRDEDYLIDYKSGRGIYFESKLQLVAYGMAEPCDRLAVVNIPDFVLTEAKINTEDRRRYELILIALAEIYALRAEIEA